MSAQVTEAEGEDKSFINSRNVANQDIINLSVSYPFDVNKWWSVYFNAYGYHSSFTPTNPDFFTIDQSTFGFYAQNTFKLPANFRAEISGWFSSPSIWGGTYLTKSLGSLDLALQRTFANDKFTARVAVSDILYTIPWRADTNFGEVSIMGSGGSDSRQLRLSLSYNFGSQEVKKARRRNSGLEDESSRIGN